MQTPSALLAGKYRYKASLQAGAKAIAWIADDTSAGREVIVSALAGARIQALKSSVGLEHSHLAALVDLIENPDAAAVLGGKPVGAVAVATHVRGETLHERLKRGPLEPALAVDWFLRLAQALAALHAGGGVHGAISPRSIVVTPAGELPGPVLTQLVAPSSGAYCAPERLQGRGPSAVDDVWALHATLFAALTCSPPFKGETKDQLLLSIAGGRQQRLDALGVSDPVLSDLVERGLTADLARRRSGIAEVIAMLESWSPEDGEWPEEEATIVASGRSVQAMAAAHAKGLRPPEPVPSIPPVRVDSDLPPALQSPSASGAGDEDDSTAIMSKPLEVQRAIAAAERSVDVPRSAAVPSELSSAPTPQAPPASVEYEAVESVAPEVPAHPGPPPRRPAPADAAPAELTPAPAETERAPPTPPAAAPEPPPAAAFPPPVSQFPPATSLPPPAQPLPTGSVTLTEAEEKALRSSGRKPLIVIGVIVLLLAIGIAVAMFLNHRASRAGKLRAAAPSVLAPNTAPAPAPSAAGSALPVTTQPSAAPAAPPATKRSLGECVAAHFEGGSLSASADYAFVCRADDLRGITSQLHRRLVVSGAGKVTPGMRLWSTFSWFDLAATAVIRQACCEAPPESSLPATVGDCPQLGSTLDGLARRPIEPGSIAERATRYESAVLCLYSKGIPRPYSYPTRPTRHARSKFEEFLSAAIRVG